MAKKDFGVHIDLMKNELLNARLQNLTTAPTLTAQDAGFTYWNTTRKTAYTWTGSENTPNTQAGWLDLGSVYEHPNFPNSGAPQTALGGAQVISKINLNNGHVEGVEVRNITPADIGAAIANHTHAFSDITGLPANTILANNTGSTGVAKAITVADFLTMLGILKGTLALLNAGTSTQQATWTAKDLNDWLNNKLNTYLTSVNLALGTRTSTTMPITNSGGTGVTLPISTTTLAGLMSAADKVKLDGIEANANKYVHPTNNPGTHPFSSEQTAGLLVLSQLVVNNEGHTVSIKGRNLTASDIASVMINDAVNNGTNTTWSSTKIFQELQNAINQAQTGALIYKGAYNPATNTPPITTDPNVKVGFTYVVSADGVFLGEAVEAGDMIIAKIDNPSGTLSNWQIVNKNIPQIVDATTLAKGIIQLATTEEATAGTNNSKAITPATLKAVLDGRIGSYVALIGDGTTTSFTVTHSLNTTKVHVQVIIVATGREIEVEWSATTSTNVVVNLNVPPANNAYEVRIIKL